MKLLFLLLLGLFSALASCTQGQDTCHGTVNGKQYDLFKLASVLPNGGVVTAPDTKGLFYSYTFKVCGELGQNDPCGPGTTAICQTSQPGNQLSCGSAAQASWTPLASGGDGFTLTFTGGLQGRLSIIEFICYTGAGTGSLSFITENSMFTYRFKWTTAYACPNGGGGGTDMCCLYAGPSSCGSDMHTICQDSSLRCPYVLGSFRLAYNWTMDSCDQCKF